MNCPHLCAPARPRSPAPEWSRHTFPGPQACRIHIPLPYHELGLINIDLETPKTIRDPIKRLDPLVNYVDSTMRRFAESPCTWSVSCPVLLSKMGAMRHQKLVGIEVEPLYCKVYDPLPHGTSRLSRFRFGQSVPTPFLCGYKERRWVLLKIPRCDIDGVGEGK